MSGDRYYNAVHAIHLPAAALDNSLSMSLSKSPTGAIFAQRTLKTDRRDAAILGRERCCNDRSTGVVDITT